MPPSRRVLRKLEELIDPSRYLFILLGEPGSAFYGLTIEEFDGIEKNPKWNQITNIRFSKLDKLTRLPPLPRYLERLSVSETAITELPELPSTLQELHLTMNRSLVPPEKLPNTLTRIIFHGNNFRILPEMPDLFSRDFSIEERELNEPFASILQAYRNTINSMRGVSQYENYAKAFFTQIREAWKRIHQQRREAEARQQGRNVLASRLVFERAGNIPREATQEITSYLSGRPAHMSEAEQLASLRNNYRKLTRRGRKQRKTNRKSRRTTLA